MLVDVQNLSYRRQNNVMSEVDGGKNNNPGVTVKTTLILFISVRLEFKKENLGFFELLKLNFM